MHTYLYCLLPRAADAVAADAIAPGDVAGVGGAPVRVLPLGDIEAWVSDVPDAVPDAPTVAAHHARVLLRAVATGRTPLPARAGQRFASDEALREGIARRHDELVSALARLDGLVEMTLHLHLAPATKAGGAPEVVEGDEPRVADESRERQNPSAGRAYLMRRKNELDHGERELQSMAALRTVAREALDDLVERDACLAVRGGGRYILCHLVRRESADRWRERAAVLRFDGVERVLVAGPLPPCSFAQVDDPPQDNPHARALDPRTDDATA